MQPASQSVASSYIPINDETSLLGEETSLLGAIPYLEIDNGEKSGVEYINASNFVIGRQGKLSSWIENSGISREHAEIRKDGLNFYLRDLNSKNGTKVNGIRVTGNEEIKLNEGDVIELPQLTLTFRI